MNLLYKLDLYKRTPTLTIKRLDSVSIIETIVFSILFYGIALAILLYNILDVYLQNKPIVQQSEEIRNINSFETIDSSKLKFGLSPNNVKLSFESATIELLRLKDPRILNIPFYNLNGNAEISFVPTFIGKQTLNSNIKYGCTYLQDNSDQLLSKNTICTEYFDKNTTIGGSSFSGGKSSSQLMELNIDFCNFFNVLDPSFDPSSIEKYIINDVSQAEYYKYIQNGDFSKPPTNSPLAKDMFLQNYTNLAYFYSGEKTNFQLEDNDYLTCDRKNRKFERFNIGILTSTDLLDPIRKEGFYEFLQSKRYEYNPYKNTLYVNIIITKVLLKTDRSLFIGFGGLDTKIIYEQEIQILEKPKIIENNNLDIKVEYLLNDRIKIVNRSYNKIDQIFAQSFSIIEIFFVIFGFFCEYLTSNQIEYEIINKLYYSDTSKSQDNYNNFKKGMKKVLTIKNISTGSIKLNERKDGSENSDNKESDHNHDNDVVGEIIDDKINSNKVDSHNVYNTENKELNDKFNDISNVNENQDPNINAKFDNLGSNDNIIRFSTNNLTKKDSNEKGKLSSLNGNIIPYSKLNGTNVNQNRTLSIHESINSLLSKNVVKINDSKESKSIDKDAKININSNQYGNSDNIVTLPIIKSFYNYKTGLKEQYSNIVGFCTKNNSMIKNIETRQHLVEEVIKEIDIINIVGKQNQLSKMFEMFAYEKYQNENVDSNSSFDEYYRQLESLMISKRVFLN